MGRDFFAQYRMMMKCGLCLYGSQPHKSCIAVHCPKLQRTAFVMRDPDLHPVDSTFYSNFVAASMLTRYLLEGGVVVLPVFVWA
jgi:hypothetical protein